MTDTISTETPQDSAGIPTDADAPRLIINPAVAIIRCSDNEVFVRHGSRSSSTHRIEDTKNRRQLANFTEAFSSPVTAEEAATASGLDPQTAAEFTRHLLDGKALITEAARDYGYLVAGMGVDKAPPPAVVVVLGEGRVAEAIARQLGDLLAAEVPVVGELAGSFESSDLVVVASDTLNPGLFYDADEAAMETGTPWQLVYVDGGEAMVGPTFVPGITVSYYDLDTMDEAGRTMRMDYQFMKTAAPSIPATAQVPLAVADLAASYASFAALQHLTGKGSFLENHVLRIDVERLHIIRDRVIRLARTPRDIASRDDLRHPFL
ncbi:MULTISPECIES: hypothetical protein [unclassified Arthrobacter]|uniref:hypothetical protein n=1 Tax=unclassified Arthrobacter TaxID=235627 RepID=UPI001492F416|nr:MULTISPECIES: hypothetical protein [unclassified Arthrobacter]MBE0010095.1 hypothetical protein [Arthrobacter sp. AET 35A]NOJ63974.1 hypothetical protein [Arthrobacter sp. 147(2020)]